jgi:ATP-binding cassette subfamily F protein uup
VTVAGLEGVTKRHAEKLVLDRVTLGVEATDRVGVIGRNGSGKSTLLRLLAGAEEPDGGTVVHARGARVAYMPQADGPLDAREATPLGVVLAAPAGFDPLDDRAAVQREARARALLDQLGVARVERPVAGRSGGERKRVALAAALVGDADLLVLDEPTNHLDVDAIEWLEHRLAAWTRALVLVTHDRYLLDAIVGRVVEVGGGALHSHAGGYASYLEARALREEQAEVAERKRANRARVELEWLRRGPKARTSKAKYRVDRAQELLAHGGHRPDVEMRIELPGRRLGGKVVNLHGAGVRYADHWVLRGIDHKLAPASRLGVVGPNGSGKTTFLRLLAGHIAPDEGSVRTGETVHAAYYGQDPAPLPPRTRVFEAVGEVVRETALSSGVRVTASQLLERFLFPGEAQQAYVEELSGGERRRLELLLVLAGAPNLLLLDEPTNDLDLDTLGVLESYLDGWDGALVVASHDRYFLDRTCDEIWSVEGGALRHHPGGWPAYRGWQREQRLPPDGVAPPPAGEPAAAAGRRRGKRSYNEQRELASLERRLAGLERRREALAGALQDAGEDYERASRVGAELAALVRELETCEDRWLELSSIGEE